MKNPVIVILVSALLMLVVPVGYTNKQVDNSPISLEINHKSPVSANSKDGEIDIKISGGTAPYEIRCMGPEFNYKVKDLKDLKLKNLSNGQYLIIVRDKEGQIKHKEVQL